MNFNWKIYKVLNMDLLKAGLKYPIEFINHYKNHGIKEGRMSNVYDLYPDFNTELYKNMYLDLLKLSKEELEEHWILKGRYEGRKYKNDLKIKEELYNFIDKVLYINLENRKDRKEELLNELYRINIPKEKIIRIDAVYNKRGILGCVRSHIKALEYAKENKLGNVLILEDDIKFIENNEEINIVFNEINIEIKKENIGLIMLAGNKKRVEVYNNLLEKAINVLTTSSYIIKGEYYDKLLENFKESEKYIEAGGKTEEYALDVWWNRLNERYILRRCIGYQRESYSDIEGGIRNYGC